MSEDGKNIGRQRQSEIYRRGMHGDGPAVPVDVETLDAEARWALSDTNYRGSVCT
jgi:hypothetical protein